MSSKRGSNNDDNNESDQDTQTSEFVTIDLESKVSGMRMARSINANEAARDREGDDSHDESSVQRDSEVTRRSETASSERVLDESGRNSTETASRPAYMYVPDHLAPGANAIQGPEYEEYDEHGTIVIGEGGDLIGDDIISARVVDVNTERELREQVASLKEQVKRLQKRNAAKQLLWVDENSSSNKFEADMLRSRGVYISNCTSTEEARRILQLQPFDLVISDVIRKEDGKRNRNAGYELLECQEMQRCLNDTPFIIYTNNVSSLDQARCSDAFGYASTPSGLLSIVCQAIFPLSFRSGVAYDHSTLALS